MGFPRARSWWILLAVLAAAGTITAARLLAGRYGRRTTFINTPTHFRSAAVAFELEAPAGWRLQYEPADHRLSAIEEAPAGEGAPAVLIASSGPLTEDVNLDGMVDIIRRQLEPDGFRFDPPREETFAGAPARTTVGHRGEVGLWLVFVARSPRFVTTIQCLQKKGTDPRGACAAPLSRLVFLSLADLPAPP